jgi:tetratricopeptide (TPR) repeat protein
MRKLNVKRLACLAGVVALFGGSTYFLHGFQVKRNAGALLQQADRAEQEDHPDKAADLLDRYLRLAPGDVDALARYGSLLDTLADRTGRVRLRTEAFFVLDRVVNRRPEAEDVRRHLVRIAMDPTMRRFTDAQDHLKTLLDKHPNDEELETLRARCLEAEGKFEEAGDEYNTAKKHAREHGKPRVELYVRLANLLRHRLSQDGEADRVLDEMVEVIEKAPGADAGLKAHAYLARGRSYQDRGSLTAAAQDVARARALAADDADVLLESAEVARDLARPDNGADEAHARAGLDEARQYVRRGLDLHPKDVRLYQALARIELQAGKPPEAIACLRRGIQAFPDEGQLYWSLAELLLDAGETGEVSQLAADMRTKRFSGTILDYLDARVLAGKGEWLQAARALERVLPALERSPALADAARQGALALGRCYERLGDLDRRYAAYQRAVNLDPLWVPGCLGIGSTLVAMGKLDEALDTYQRIIPRAPGARVVVARLLVLRNLSLPPDRRDWKEVQDLLKQAERTVPGSVDVPLLQADVAAAQGQLDQAQLVLEQALPQKPKQVEVRIALANLAERRGKEEEALAAFDTAERDLGDSVELRLARAGYWARHDESKEHRQLSRLTEGLDHFSADDQDRVLRGVAQAFVQVGDNATAAKLWGAVAQRQPNDLGLRLVLFDLAQQAGDDAAMDRCLGEMQAIEGPEGSLWRYGKVSRLVRQVQKGNKELLPEARALLADLGKRRPTWGRVPATEGLLDELAGEPDLAIDAYKRAVDLGDQRPPTVLRLVQLLSGRNRAEEADRVLRKLPDYVTLSGPLQRLSAEIAFQNQDYGQALERAKRTAAADSNDYREHLWLGQVYWANDKKAEAEAAFAKALQLAPDKPEVWVASVSFLAASDRKKEAEARLAEAEHKLSGDKAALALAKCYEMLGRWDDARKRYAGALKDRPEDVNTLHAAALFYWGHGQAEEARQCLETLSSLKDKAPTEAAWAQRLLTVLIALDGDPRKAQKALAALDQTEVGKEGQLSVGERAQNQRTRAVVLAVQRDFGKRLEAIKILEAMKEGGRLDPEDRFLLAELYEAAGEWPRAREEMMSLLGSRSASPAFLLRMAGSFLRENELDAARTCLGQLKKAAPQALATLAVEARVLKAEGKVSQAVDLLKQYAGTDGANPLQVAAALEQIKGSEAEEYYRKYVAQSKQPESALVLGAYLGRQNRADEALDLCERAWATCRPEAVAFASVAVLYDVQATPAQCRRVELWLNQASAKEGLTPALTFDLASLRNLQGRYQEAEALYRKVTDQPKPTPEALNNLAWLLAFRNDRGGEALEVINRAVAAVGPLPGLLDTRGVVELRVGQFDKALQDLQSAVTLNPDAAGYFHLAQAYLAARKRDEAARALRKAEGLGLKRESLHPLERDAYEPVRAALQG